MTGLRPCRAPLAIGVLAVVGTAQSEALSLRLEADRARVVAGEPFALRVSITRFGDVTVEDFDDARLAPLTVRLLATERAGDGDRIRETHTYQAWAFSPGVVTLAPRVRGTRNDAAMTARADELRLEVASALGTTPGAVELPREPFPAPFRWLPAAVLASAVLAGGALLLRYARSRAATAAATQPPYERALRALEELRRSTPQGFDALQEDSIAVSSVVRAYIAERFEVRAPEMTTEEFLAAALERRGVGEHRELLAAFLTHCDAVKFAHFEPALEERERQIDAAERFVQETA